MRRFFTTEQVRAAEEPILAALPPYALMRRAAFGIAVATADLLAEHTGGVAGRRVLLLVGAGNNGGDALWAGAYLRRRGVAVTAVLLDPARAHDAGLAAFRRAGGRVSPDLVNADVVIDGIVGLSARGPLRPTAAALMERVTAPILAVDLPSGVDPDTGAVTGPAVRAEVTVTFGAYKPVHVLAPEHCGYVRLVDLGLDLDQPYLETLEAVDVGALWPVPGAADDKYSQGVTGLAAGSARYPGAAVLTVGGAVQATSGLVRYAGPCGPEVHARWPEVVAAGSVPDAGRVQSWVVGPGLGTGSSARQTLAQVLAAGVPVCADADAITLLAADPALWDERDPGTPVVLTPHAGEFARLTTDPGPDRVAAVRAAATKFNAVVLLKGNRTIIADPSGRVLVNPARSAWPATAGSGDVLSGIIGALLATGLDPLIAAASAAYAHVLAADLAAGNAPTSASHIVDAVPAAIRVLRGTAAAE